MQGESNRSIEGLTSLLISSTIFSVYDHEVVSEGAAKVTYRYGLLSVHRWPAGSKNHVWIRNSGDSLVTNQFLKKSWNWKNWELIKMGYRVSLKKLFHGRQHCNRCTWNDVKLTSWECVFGAGEKAGEPTLNITMLPLTGHGDPSLHTSTL